MNQPVKSLLAMAITAALSLGSTSTFAASCMASNDTFATAATATSVQSSTLTFNDQGIAIFSGSVSAGNTDFNNLYTFTTTSGSGGASSIASFNGTNFSAAFTSFNLLDVDNGNSVVATGLIGPSFVTQLGFSGLDSNTLYGLNIVGTVTNPSLGSVFSGSLTVSPVPEPAEYLLLSVGLSFVGFIANRRRKDPSFSAA